MKKEKAHSMFTVMMALVLSIISILSTSITSEASNQAASIPAFSGVASITVNQNKPTFTKDEITTTSYELYGKLDELGRCTAAMACVGQDIMPTKERESIGMVKPTGWKQNKYPGLVNSNPPYLYNRCHIIGYQLTGENANTKNLITGTRYMNCDGMLPYEDQVAHYVKSTGNHVMYRVTPYFEGKNLLCNGVQIEAYSVEDSGKGISLNVFCYNVQPGVIINYADGSNSRDSNYIAAQNETSSVTTPANNTVTNPAPTSNTTAACTYVGNKKSKIFHYPSCKSVKQMKESNKVLFDGSREDAVNQGYRPCQNCCP